MATSIKLDDNMKHRIQHLADIKHRSAHWLMREAIRDYIEREEMKENFKQEALESWKAYKETGRHLTNKEVGQWLASWGTEQETKTPPCHD